MRHTLKLRLSTFLISNSPSSSPTFASHRAAFSFAPATSAIARSRSFSSAAKDPCNDRLRASADESWVERREALEDSVARLVWREL